MSHLQWFFRNPRQAPRKGDSLSPLYLLRRDIETCFGIDPNTGLQMRPVDDANHTEIYCKAIWPGTMAILTGIDLLAQFLEGSDRSGGKGNRNRKHSVSWRFKKFARKYMQMTKEEANLIYQLRNSLLHSFSLYSEEKGQKGRIKAINYFIIYQGLEDLIVTKHEKICYINASCLYLRFNNAIVEYFSHLNSPSRRGYKTRIANFNKMIKKHTRFIICLNI